MNELLIEELKFANVTLNLTGYLLVFLILLVARMIFIVDITDNFLTSQKLSLQKFANNLQTNHS